MAIPAKRDDVWALVAMETKRRKRRWKMAEPLADERCSGALLEFLRTTDVGRMVPPPKADTESEFFFRLFILAFSLGTYLDYRHGGTRRASI